MTEITKNRKNAATLAKIAVLVAFLALFAVESAHEAKIGEKTQISAQNREFSLFLPMSFKKARFPAQVGVFSDLVSLAAFGHELDQIPISWVRLQWVHAGESMFEAWKRGGWQELDARMAPLFERVDRLGLKVYLNFMYGGDCKVLPSRDELAYYGSFVTQATDRYPQVERVSPWNEWDYKSGEARYYGCFGRTNWQEYVFLLQHVNPRRALVVSEFGFSNPGTENYLPLVEPYVDEIAIHHYGVYLTDVVNIWPGTAAQALELAKQHTSLRVLLTETSVREPSETMCWWPHFQSRQADVNIDNLTLETPLIFYFNYGSRWQCTNIRNTEFLARWRELK